MDLIDLTVSEAAQLIRKRETSSHDLVRACLDRIRAVDATVGAFVDVYEKDALSEAHAADNRIAEGGAARALEGVPVAVKDNLCVTGRPVTCSSKILKGFIAPYTATVIERLREAGAILIGRTNMDEFAMGSSTETSCYGLTRNPWDTGRVPGGSSGGSVAAVAAREAPASLGSDTGGSIRQPAALCGVAGLKPTYGYVSRYGLVAFASSLDQIGPIARSVRDIAVLLEIIGGHDPRDSTSVKRPAENLVSSLGGKIENLRIGVPKEYFVEGMDPEVKEAIRAALEKMQSAGATIVDVSLPHTEYAVATYYVIATAEASSNLARYDGVQYGYRAPHPTDLLDMYQRTKSEGFGAEVKRRIMLGTYVLSSGYYDAYYLKAQKVRTLLKKDFEDAFKLCDVIATPASPTAAFKVGEKVADPLQMYLSDIFTISVNLAGVPAISVPCGFTSNTLPIGLQLIGRHFGEGTLLKVAHAYESMTDWHKKQPKV
ncbi:MAG: Asp-tRNA(Asn)/Glu-tRNA(Gln) amidotransferase subunit GatA [Candidatus Aureabacteria bacterium]|nr:Asp-tRNA(Asn)/Glu-tRNA(Gln) amidotransferase subunit GatA [Candidatus Auribacterota bacterium]